MSVFNNGNVVCDYISEDATGAKFRLTWQVVSMNKETKQEILVPLEDWEKIKEDCLKDNTYILNWISGTALAPYTIV